MSYFSLLLVPLIIYVAKYHSMKHDYEYLQKEYARLKIKYQQQLKEKEKRDEQSTTEI